MELVGKSGSESEPSDNVMSMSMSWSSEVKSLFLTKNHSFTKATRNLLHDHWCLQLFFFFRFGGVLKLQDVGQQYCCNHCWGESKSSKAKGKHPGSFKEEVSMGFGNIFAESQATRCQPSLQVETRWTYSAPYHYTASLEYVAFRVLMCETTTITMKKSKFRV